MIDDPFHVPAALRRDNMDYQWLNPAVRGDPRLTGWFLVLQSEMPGVKVEQRDGMRLYCRSLRLSQRVAKQETEVALALLRGAEDISSGKATVQPRLVARPLTSPRGPMPGKRNLRDTAIYISVLFRKWLGCRESAWLVQKFCYTTEVGIKRWADENRVMPAEYVSLHTQAILDGKGRWPGQIIRSARR